MTAEKPSWTICIVTIHRRRSTRSAIAPAGMASTNSGPNCATIIRPTSEALSVRV
jgi:hypothetical protein